ncbi:MAG: serine/threonine-protein kinase [Planctomycetota bacterium]
MLKPDENAETAAAEIASVQVAFLKDLLRDRDAGAERSLAEYQARYPGFEQVIADELRSAQQPPAALEVPGLPSRYRVLGAVARGGMGTVLRVHDATLDRELALKVSHHHVHVAEAVAEARLVGGLWHPGVVPVHDAGMTGDGRAWFTMELVRGDSLHHAIDRHHAGDPAWPRARLVEVLVRVCDTVAFAHARGVAHRDLKPTNVMIGAFGEVLVLDWGLALADADGAAMGTPSFLAPEQLAGAGGEPRRADVYALGAILHQVLSGCPPYLEPGRAAPAAAVIERVRRGPPPEPRGPTELLAIRAAAMARDPERRYASAAELADDLRRFAAQRVVRAWRTGALAEAGKWVARNRLAAACLALVLVALVAFGVVLHGQRQRALAAAARADRSLQLTMAAIDAMLHETAHGALRSAPGMTGVRRALLLRAVELEQQLVAIEQAGGHGTVGDRLARAHYRLADLRAQLGDVDGAGRAYRDALDAIAPCLLAAPDDAGLRLDLAAMLSDQGRLLVSVGQVEPALQAWREAVARCEVVLAVSTLPPALAQRGRVVLLTSLDSWGNQLHDARRFDEAMVLRRQASEVAASLVGGPAPSTASELSHVSRVWINRGNTEAAVERDADAGASYRRALEAAQVAAARFPDSLECRHNLARAHNAIAVWQQEAGEGPRAEASARAAIAIRRALVADYPAFPELRSELGGNLHNLAQSLLGRGDAAGARVLLVEAEAEQERALAVNPGHRVYRSYMSYHENALCQALLALGELDAALACAERLGVQPAGGVPGWLAPRYVAECALRVVDDDRTLAVERAQRAKAMLREALAAGTCTGADLDHEMFVRLGGLVDVADLRR